MNGALQNPSNDQIRQKTSACKQKQHAKPRKKSLIHSVAPDMLKVVTRLSNNGKISVVEREDQKPYWQSEKPDKIYESLDSPFTIRSGGLRGMKIGYEFIIFRII